MAQTSQDIALRLSGFSGYEQKQLQHLFENASSTPAANVAALVDSSGGTVSNTLAAIVAGAAYSQADAVALKNAVASLAATVDAIRTAMVNAGLMVGP